MTSEAALTQQLDALEAQLPQMIRDNPYDGDFWSEFAGAADALEPLEAELTDLFHERITAMLANHGRYLAGIDFDQED